MKKILGLFCFCLLAFSSVQALEPCNNPPLKPQDPSFLAQTTSERVPVVALREELPEAVLQRRGCCSHHKGVCGCENGRAVCCDGKLSPSCGCN